MMDLIFLTVRHLTSCSFSSLYLSIVTFNLLKVIID